MQRKRVKGRSGGRGGRVGGSRSWRDLGSVSLRRERGGKISARVQESRDLREPSRRKGSELTLAKRVEAFPPLVRLLLEQRDPFWRLEREHGGLREVERLAQMCERFRCVTCERSDRGSAEPRETTLGIGMHAPRPWKRTSKLASTPSLDGV